MLMSHDGDQGIVVVGSSNTDLTVRVRSLPLPGETVLGADLLRAQGGKGANQAVAAARAGARVTFVGCLGDDAFGDAALASLRADGVDTRHVRRLAGTPSGVALIAVADGGQNSIVVAPGANERLAVPDIEAALPTLRAARLVVAQLEVPLASTAYALACAHASGVATLLNPAPAQDLPSDLLSQLDLLVCNESEAEFLTSMHVGDIDGAEAAAHALLSRGPRAVILTRGAQGCVVVSAHGSTQVSAFAVPILDTTGAGDAFIGALAARLAAGDPLVPAARYATAGAALSVQCAGAQPAFPHAAAIAAFLGEHENGA